MKNTLPCPMRTESKRQTYAESKGAQPFDWSGFLDRAIAGDVSDEEMRAAKKLAMVWVTCACGNQCADIPRDECGTPLDPVSRYAGTQFDAEVGNEDWQAARTTLAQIESRSHELLEQMRKENK